MKLMLMACIFFAGVYLGLHADPDGGLVNAMAELENLLSQESEW